MCKKVMGLKLIYRLLVVLGLVVFVLGDGLAQAPFITTWQTDNPGSSCSSCITIPTTGSGYNYEVDWDNDGVYDESGITGNVTHDFGTAGTYTIALRGDFPRVYFNNSTSLPDNDSHKIINIGQWGDIEWTSFARAFDGCKFLESDAIDSPNLTNVTSFHRMFGFASNFNSNLNNWDVSNITNMEAMFSRATMFNGDISNWNMSSVTNIERMFEFAENFNQDIGGWNVNNVTDMASLFQSAESFNQDISGWNVSNITNMRDMFNGASSFDQDISNWNIDNVNNIVRIFSGASSFNQDISSWKIDNGLITNLSGVFDGASSFNQDISNWNVENILNFSSLFEDATSFDGDISSWNVANGQSFSEMFMNAVSFNQDLSSWNTSNALSMLSMFNGAESVNFSMNSWNFSTVLDLRRFLNGATDFNQSLASILFNENVNLIWSNSGFINGSGIDCQNYSSSLIGWLNNASSPSNLNLGFLGGMEYGTGQATTARSSLINDLGWTINGDTQGSCNFPCALPAGQQEDYDALIVLYNSTNGDNWTNNGTNATPQSATEGWGKDCDVCKWYGIECNVNDRVICIDLDGNLNCLNNNTGGGNNLFGILPSDIQYLNQLDFLSLLGNSLNGEIPNQVGSLSNLRSLYLSNNNFSGEIPNEIGNLQLLENLYLNGNVLTGDLPQEIGDLENLERLNLGGNQLEGVLPSELGLLTNLTHFDLDNNQFDGSIPPELGNLNQLQSLYLNDNLLTGEIPIEIENLEILNNLVLNNNFLSGEIPSQIGDLSNLSNLNFHSNQLSGCLAPNLYNLCTVSTVNFSNNNLLPWQGDFDQFCLTNGTQDAQFGAPCNDGDDSNGTDDTIQEDCSCGPCTHPDYDALIALYNSTNGDNWTNNGTNADPQSSTEGWGKDCDICEWYGIICNSDNRVSTINMYSNGANGNNLQGVIPIEIGNLSQLENLTLRNGDFSGSTIPNSFSNLSLNTFNCGNCNLDGPLPDDLFLSMQLSASEIWIPNNNFNSNLPTQVLPSQSICNLVLSNCGLTGSIPSSLYDLDITCALSLDQNNIEGELESQIENWTNLSELNLGGNQFTGNVPSEISNMSSLTFGLFSDNSFNGCVPIEMLSMCSPADVNFSLNPLLPWQGDFDQFCMTNGSMNAQVGAPCNDGDDSNGTNDEILDDCSCGQPCPTITPTLSGPAEVCEGDNATYSFNFSDGLGPYTITWNGGETLTNINDGHTETITNVSTNLSLMVTQGNDSNGCLLSNSNTINLTVNPLPSGNISGDFEICEGESTTITASGGNTYEWSTTEFTPSITVSPIVTTTYMVTVTDANLCTDITSQEILVNPNPTAQITGNLEICESETTMLTASGGSSYAWSTGENTPTIETNTTDADYSVTVTDGSSCSDESSVTLIVNDLPLLVVNGDNEICNGETANITASGDGTMYNWDSGQNTAMISVSPSMTTTYTVTATDNNSCTQVAFWTVTVNNLPIAQITGENEVCDGASITLTASGGIIYNWSDGQSGPSIDINPTSNTTYTVTVSDANNCSSTASQSVTVLPLPVIINPSPISLCDDGSGSATTNLFDFDNTISDGQPGATVTWSESNIEPLIPLTGGDNYTVSNSTILYAQVDNGTCDSEIITINFLVENDIVVTNPSPISLCSDGGLGLDIDPQDYSTLLTNGNPSFSVNWSANNTMLPLITGTIFINDGASLFAQVTDGECSSIVTEISFQVNNIPLVTMPSDISTCAFDSNGDGLFDLTIFENEINGGLGYSVVWSEDEQGQSIINNTNAYIGFDGVIIYASVDDGICQSTFIEIPLIVYPLPAIQENLIIETCQAFSNESVQIDLSVYEATLSNGNTIAWSESQNDNLIINNPSNFQTSASVTIYAKATSNGCESEYTPVEIILTDAPSPTINTIGGMTNICPNISFELSINGTFDQIDWSTGEQGAFIEITEGGTYSVTVTDGDCTGESEIFITESDLNLDCAVLDNDVTIMVISSALPYDVSWSSGTVSGSETGLTSNNYTINDLPSGEYTVEVTDGMGCVVSCDVEVENTSGCDHPDVATLLALFEATNGVNWTEDMGWINGNCDPCDKANGGANPWYGISCDKDDERVTDIELINNNLNGEIILLSDLDSLRRIVLSNNQLEGGNWNFDNPELRVIAVDGNSELKTTIPDFDLPNLEEIFTFASGLSGPLPEWSNVPNLREVFIFDNPYNDTIPDWELDSLRNLSLYNCGLTGELPSFPSSTKLFSFYADSNNLEGPIPDYTDKTELDTLVLRSNNLSGCVSTANYCDIGWFTTDNNPLLPFGGDTDMICQGLDQIGAACDDGDATTIDDMIQPDCNCEGESDGEMRPFVTTWVTNNPGVSCNTCIQVPTFEGEIYNYEVDVDYVMGEPFDADFTGITGDFEYDFGIEDTVTIAIRGEFPRIYFEHFSFNDSDSKDNFKIFNINQWGDIRWTSMEDAFFDCVNMESDAIDIPNLTEVSSLKSCFQNCKVFNGDISQWNVSSITNMNSFLFLANNFNINIENWKTENCSDMGAMFYFAKSFNRDISNWDVSNVVDMGGMLSDCDLFNQNLGSWNISSVANLIFAGNGIFDNSGLSCENYSATLAGWAENENTPNNLEMQALGMTYNDLGQEARDTLTAKGWDITGDDYDPTCNAPCSHPDYTALEAFYQSTNGDDWDDNDGWLSNCDPCDSLNNYANPWYGLCCDESINRVRGIDMFGIANCDEDGAIVGSGNHLTGSIPLSINQLTELTFFDIERSNVTGPIPSTLPDLVNLRYFDISENDMTGPIPNNIGNLQELIFFDLQANSINDTLPNSITEIKTLEFFDLESTGMFGKIPFGFGELNDLYLFDIQFNNFSGKLPDDIGNIDLDFFDVLGFYINDNNFSDCIPPSLSNYCDKLGVDVDIRNNPLIPNGGDYWDEFCDGQDQEGQPCGIALDSIIVDCNCLPVEDCPTPICKTDITDIIFVQEGRKIPLDRVLDDGFPVRDCYSFDPVMDVDTFLLVCADVCTIKEVTVYNLTTGESCTTDVYVSQQEGVCSEFDVPDITVELIDQGYTGGEFISIDVILDGLVDITEYSFQIQFDTFELEFIEGINLNNELAPSVDFFTIYGPYVRVKRDDNNQSINSVFVPTRIATLVFRIKNQPFCGETTFDVASDAFNAFLTCQSISAAIEATYIPTTVIYNHPLPITNQTLLEVCENEEISVTIENANDYQSIIWQNSGSDVLTVNPSETTNYNLILVDINGCALDTSFSISVIECEDCAEGGCLASNPPAFIDPPSDIVVSCAEDVPSLSILNFTNNQDDDCPESGFVMSSRDSTNFNNCQGSITEIWSYPTMCGDLLEHSRTIMIESLGVLQFENTPNSSIDINCDANEIENLAIELDYMLDSGSDCIPMGSTMPTMIIEDYNECGGTVTLTWQVDNPCGDPAVFTQVANVLVNNNFDFLDKPENITLSCNQLPFEPAILIVTNGSNDACAISQEIEAVSVETTGGCPGQTVNTWAFFNSCNGEQISHQQIVTLVDCAAATLEEDYIEVRAGDINDINVFDNDVIPDSFSTKMIEIEREELFLAQNYEEDGLFEFAISESFFDTLRVTYEVCNLECDNCVTGTLKIVDEALKDIILTDIITPNGDEQNDLLRFNFEDEIMGSQLYIYNRWGDKIYEKLNYTNDWDSSGYPGGVYFYVLRIGDAEVKKTLTVVK